MLKPGRVLVTRQQSNSINDVTHASHITAPSGGLYPHSEFVFEVINLDLTSSIFYKNFYPPHTPTELLTQSHTTHPFYLM